MEHQFSFKYTKHTFETLTDKEQHFLQQAIDATTHAYAPYSRFHVGCAILMTNDSIITASNMENAAYPASICAERVALSHIHSLKTPHSIKAIAIAYHNHNKPEDNHIISPCGECRQVIMETAIRQRQPIEVWLIGSKSNIIYLKSQEYLLPFGFDPSQLL